MLCETIVITCIKPVLFLISSLANTSYTNRARKREIVEKPKELDFYDLLISYCLYISTKVYLQDYKFPFLKITYGNFLV